jgi:flagellar protein FliO/FliZ
MTPLAQAWILASDAPVTLLTPAAGSGSPALPSVPSGGSSLGLGLFIFACATAGAWLWWRARSHPAGSGGRSERRLAIAETRSLGSRQYLVVAAYDGKKYLLGVCPGRIDLLTPLDGDTHASLS